MPDVPESRPPAEADKPQADDRPGGLVGLLVGGVELVVALLGRLLAGLATAILGNLMGRPPEDERTEPPGDPPTTS